MEPASSYLKKHSTDDNLIKPAPEKDLRFIVVIPAYIETRLEESLVSLFNAEPPSSPVEILIIVNWPEDDTQENIRLSHEIFSSAVRWAEQHSTHNKRFHVAEKGFIPRKKAGVGFARKTGMDEAVRRFLQAGQEEGIIISFDADTKCESNYFQAIEEHFLHNSIADGCSIYFEHPLDGTRYNSAVYNAITQYELHMRCYLHAIRQSGFPNAFYTVGSAFAIRASAYCRQGGMNIRQAGEDFYFLQKFFDLGNFSDLLTTTVIPSPRPSLRVPFGTGKAIDQLLKSGETLKSYHPVTFDILREFFSTVPQLFEEDLSIEHPAISGLHPCLKEFLDNSGFAEELRDIQKNSGSASAFSKRFYRYFNMFRILKFAKFARRDFPELPVSECALSIMHNTGMKTWAGMSEKEMLLEFRKIDRNLSGQQ